MAKRKRKQNFRKTKQAIKSIGQFTIRHKEKIMPCLIFLFIGYISGLNADVSGNGVIAEIKDSLKLALNTDCSCEMATNYYILDNTNEYESINWIKYNCSEGVEVQDWSRSSLYMSTWKHNVSYGTCIVDYIKPIKSYRIEW